MSVNFIIFNAIQAKIYNNKKFRPYVFEFFVYPCTQTIYKSSIYPSIYTYYLYVNYLYFQGASPYDIGLVYQIWTFCCCLALKYAGSRHTQTN